jgi:hypothetical protein
MGFDQPCKGINRRYRPTPGVNGRSRASQRQLMIELQNRRPIQNNRLTNSRPTSDNSGHRQRRQR